MREAGSADTPDGAEQEDRGQSSKRGGDRDCREESGTDDVVGAQHDQSPHDRAENHHGAVNDVKQCHGLLAATRGLKQSRGLGQLECAPGEPGVGLCDDDPPEVVGQQPHPRDRQYAPAHAAQQRPRSDTVREAPPPVHRERFDDRRHCNKHPNGAVVQAQVPQHVGQEERGGHPGREMKSPQVGREPPELCRRLENVEECSYGRAVSGRSVLWDPEQETGADHTEQPRQPEDQQVPERRAAGGTHGREQGAPAEDRDHDTNLLCGAPKAEETTMLRPRDGFRDQRSPGGHRESRQEPRQDGAGADHGNCQGRRKKGKAAKSRERCALKKPGLPDEGSGAPRSRDETRGQDLRESSGGRRHRPDEAEDDTSGPEPHHEGAQVGLTQSLRNGLEEPLDGERPSSLGVNRSRSCCPARRCGQDLRSRVGLASAHWQRRVRIPRSRRAWAKHGAVLGAIDGAHPDEDQATNLVNNKQAKSAGIFA
jgi:hypothetical protein